jgi:ABC-type uncharacterized transport system ATPase subunit
VHSVQQFGARTTVQVATDLDIQALLRTLVERGVELRKFDANDMSLHDIFVLKTRGSMKLRMSDNQTESEAELSV